ncbi:MAG: HEAT repeat domain-containing protein [Acidobacteriia bacterium]|nr:HEAT repeat domain-containing protein [Terriglobia bacterium]
MKCARTAGLFLGLALLLSGSLWGEQPHFVNARLQTVSMAGSLASQLESIIAKQNEPAWIAYSVPAIDGSGHMCCGEYEDSMGWTSCSGCRLEGKQGSAAIDREGAQPREVKLESPRSVNILIRVAERRVDRIRVFSSDCDLDAGGLSVYFVPHAASEESIKLLSKWVLENGDEAAGHRSLTGQGVMAIAMHAGVAAEQALDGFTASSQPESLRRQAVFWLGSVRGQAGFEVLKRLVTNDPSEKIREHAVFALSISKVPQAVEAMIRTAHDDPSAHVRGQALFWLAQKAGRKSVGAISDAIQNDPATAVKRRAVFALSRLPKDEGIPKLIEVAQTNRNAAVRKQAIFWLGQSKDPRALNFIEQLLLH